MSIFTIREFTNDDTRAIVHLFTETVRTINSQDYSREQIEAWAPRHADVDAWERKLARTITLIAEEDQEIRGFAQLEDNGHIDCFYVANNFINKGIGSRLLTDIERRATSLRLQRLFTEASVTARSFFLRKGFSEVREQEVELRGVRFKNYVMQKDLDSNI
jgi:putative acetyltransferase